MKDVIAHLNDAAAKHRSQVSQLKASIEQVSGMVTRLSIQLNEVEAGLVAERAAHAETKAASLACDECRDVMAYCTSCAGTGTSDLRVAKLEGKLKAEREAHAETRRQAAIIPALQIEIDNHLAYTVEARNLAVEWRGLAHFWRADPGGNLNENGPELHWMDQ